MQPATWRLEAAVRSDKGRVRKNNQDSYGFFPDLGLFMVADGLGGHQGGEVASRMTVDVVHDVLAATHDDDDMTPMTDPHGLVSLGARRLLRALDDANASVWEAGRDPERHGMGTTVVALLFDRDYDVLAVCHVGDSRVFRMRADEVVQLTEDHTVVQQWVREGRIGPEEAARSPHRHMITQAVGTQEAVNPALRLERPQLGDVFVSPRTACTTASRRTRSPACSGPRRRTSSRRAWADRPGEPAGWEGQQHRPGGAAGRRGRRPRSRRRHRDPLTSMGHTPPTIVAGKYEILGQLGQGGQGSVWKVRHVELDQIRAMKWQPDQGIDDSATRFRREGRALARLRHPHIVQVFDLGRDGDAHYLVMEYVDGPNLAQWLKTRGRRPRCPTRSRSRARWRARSPTRTRQPYIDSHRHAARRDDPPRHQAEQHPAARAVPDARAARRLRAREARRRAASARPPAASWARTGTARRSSSVSSATAMRVGVDLRADVFAFGLVLYELLEGRQFHEGLDMGEVLGRVLYEDLEPEFAQPLSAKLRTLVTSCIRRFPEERPDTMDVVLGELDASMADFRGEETQTRFVPHAEQDIDEQIEVLMRERDRRRLQVVQGAARAARQEALASQAESLAAELFTQAAGADEAGASAAQAGQLDEARRAYERASALFAEARSAAVAVGQRREIDGLLAEVTEQRVRAEEEAAAELAPEPFARAAKLEAGARDALARGVLDGVARDLRAAHVELSHATRDAVAVRTRREAKAARQRLEAARREAEVAGAPELAARAFVVARDVETQAEAALGSGDLLVARDLFERAAAAFARAGREAAAERDRRAAAAAREATERARTAAEDAGAAELAADEVREAAAVRAEAEAALARDDAAGAAAAFARAAQAFDAAATAARTRGRERARTAAARVREEADTARREAIAAGLADAALRVGDAARAAADARGGADDFAAAETEYARARRLYLEALASEREARVEAARLRAEQARTAAERAHASRIVRSTHDAAEAERERARQALAADRVADAEAGYAKAAALYEHATADAAALRERASAARDGAAAARAGIADDARRWAGEALAGADALARAADELVAAHDPEAACARYADAARAFAAAGATAANARAEELARAKDAAERARVTAATAAARAEAADAEGEAAPLMREAVARVATGARALAAGEHEAATAAFTQAASAYERAASEALAAIDARARRAEEARARARTDAERARVAAETVRDRAVAAGAANDAAAELAAGDARRIAGDAALGAGDHATAVRELADATAAYERAIAVAAAAAEARERAAAEARAEAEARARAEAEERTRARRLAEQARDAATAARDGTATLDAERDAAAEMQQATTAFAAGTTAYQAGDYATAARRFTQAAIAYDEAATVVQAAAEARARAEAEARQRADTEARERAAVQARDAALAARQAAAGAEADAAQAMQQATARLDAATAAFDSGDHGAAEAAFRAAAASFDTAAATARAAGEARARAEAEARTRTEAERAREEADRAKAREAAERARARAVAAREVAEGTTAERDAAADVHTAATRFAEATAALEQGDPAHAERAFAEAAGRFADAAATARAAAEARARAEAQARAKEAEEKARARQAAEQARDRAGTARTEATRTSAERDAADVLRAATDVFATATGAFDAGDYAAAARDFGRASEVYAQAASTARAAEERRAKEDTERRKREAAEAKAREAEAKKAREAEAKARAADEKRARAEAARERDAVAAKARREAEARAAEPPAVDGDMTRTQVLRPEPVVEEDRTQLEAKAADRTQVAALGGDVRAKPEVAVPPVASARVETPAVKRTGLSPLVMAGGAAALVAAGVAVWIATWPEPEAPRPPRTPLEFATLMPSKAEVAAGEGKAVVFTVALKGGEPVGDAEYAWTVDGKRQAAGASWTFTPDFAGGARRHEVRVQASRAGEDIEHAWRVEVANVDRPPHIESPAEEKTTVEVDAGAPVVLQVRASDPDLADGDALSYAWERGGQRIASATDPALELSDARDGERIRVAVVDKEGLEAWREWTIGVKDKAPDEEKPAAPKGPTIVDLSPPAKPFELAAGTTRTFRVKATDPDPGDTVRYAWLVGARQVASDASFVLEAPADAKDGQALAVKLEVTDGTGNQLAREWKVTVTVPRPRVTSAEPRGPEVTVEPGESRAFVVRASSERAGARIRYEWTLDGRPVSGAVESLELPTDLSLGRHTVQVVALDERDLASEARRWSVVVKPDEVIESGAVTKDDVQRWLGQYRAAFQAGNAEALVALGVAANLSEGERMTGGWKRDVEISVTSIDPKGSSATVVFKRVDTDKESGRVLPHPAPLTYQLRKDGAGLRAVR